MLSASPAGAIRINPQIIFLDDHLNTFINLGHNIE